MCVSRPARRAKYCSVRAYAILGLAAATGFRVFVPLRVAGLTARGLGAAHRILRLAPEHAGTGCVEHCSRAGNLRLLHSRTGPPSGCPGSSARRDRRRSRKRFGDGRHAARGTVADCCNSRRRCCSPHEGSDSVGAREERRADRRIGQPCSKYRRDCGSRDGVDPRDRRAAAMPRRRHSYCRVGSAPTASITGWLNTATARNARNELLVVNGLCGTLAATRVRPASLLL